MRTTHRTPVPRRPARREVRRAGSPPGSRWPAVLTVATAVLGSLVAGGLGHPASAAGPAPAEAVLGSMTLDQQVGEVFMVGTPATSTSSAVVSAVRDRHVGSVILTGRSRVGVAATNQTAAGLQALATTSTTAGAKLLIAADQEGGQVQVLQGPGFSAIPSALSQGQQSPDALRRSAGTWGQQLWSAGVNVDLAPVLDTVPSPAAAPGNAPIGAYGREYGYTPQAVADHGTAFAQGMADAQVITSGKHFPGLGRVAGNTDTTAGVTDTVTTRSDAYLQPFATAVRAGMPMLMMSSAYYSRIDPQSPAAFSSTVIDGMVRGDLGFHGVVISDDLGDAQQVAAWSPGDRAVRFLRAGGDLVLTVDAAQLPAMYDSVLSLARSDAGFRARVREAALRVLQLKQTRGFLHSTAPSDPAGTLTGGRVLPSGQWLMSPDGSHGLALQDDGNLVAYGPGYRPLWYSGTYGHPGAVLTMQEDGNAVLYASDGTPLWNSGTYGEPGARLVVQNDGNVVVHPSDGSVAWYSGWDRTGLTAGQGLEVGQQVTSPDGRFWLRLEQSGDLVVWAADGRRVFTAGSQGADQVVDQPDGNLVAYRPDGVAVWSSGTYGRGASRLAVQDDGNVVLYLSDGRVSWCTGWDGGGNASGPSTGTVVPVG